MGNECFRFRKKESYVFNLCFCRIVDDIADEIKNKKLKIEKLKSWKKKISNIFESKKLKSSIEKELKIAVEKFQLERLDFYAIIDGMMMDAKSDIKFPKKKILSYTATE